MIRKKLLVGIIVILLLSMVSTALAGELTGFCAKCKEKITKANLGGSERAQTIYYFVKEVKADAIDSIPSGKTIYKADLIEVITSNSGLSKADSKRALDAFIGTTTKALRSGDRVALVGFGSFSVSKRNHVRFKAGNRPFRHNVEYATTEDIIKGIAGYDSPTEEFTSGDSERLGLNEDQARQFMDSFINVTLKMLQTGIIVNLGEDFGTFWHANHMQYSKQEIQNSEEVVMKNGRRIWTGHVDHGKGRIKFKAGTDLAKAVA